ncbi:hypothetical protein BDAP_001446 [Binucleata daphniae]
MLTKVFKITQYPCTDTRMNIAILLDMQPRSIQIWFQNMRQAIKDSTYKGANNENTNISHNNKAINDNPNELKDKHLKKKIVNGQYLSYEISSAKLLRIYINLKQKMSLHKTTKIE